MDLIFASILGACVGIFASLRNLQHFQQHVFVAGNVLHDGVENYTPSLINKEDVKCTPSSSSSSSSSSTSRLLKDCLNAENKIHFNSSNSENENKVIITIKQKQREKHLLKFELNLPKYGNWSFIARDLKFVPGDSCFGKKLGSIVKINLRDYNLHKDTLFKQQQQLQELYSNQNQNPLPPNNYMCGICGPNQNIERLVLSNLHDT
jgi:hypothetical protein